MIKIFKIILIILIVLMGLALLCLGYLFVGKAKPSANIIWGVTFSQKHAELLGLDWRETYKATFEDLGVKHIKLVVYWDMVEEEKDEYDFEDVDWQINEAVNNGAEIILVIGKKVPRWPECHIPAWAEVLEVDEQNQELLQFLKEIVLRYQDNNSIKYWQIENEPFFPFGKCASYDASFVQEEIKEVKSFDSSGRPIMITESGELPFWFKVARLADVVGVSMYQKVWADNFGAYIDYPLPPVFYSRKAKIINTIFHKRVICMELQAEPWGPVLLYDLALAEQEKTMNLEQFKKNIEFAKNTGFDEFYLWGNEWWYWMKEKQGRPEIWGEAKKLWQ